MDDNTAGMLVAVRLRPLTEHEKNKGQRTCCRVVGDQVVVIEKFGQPNGHLKSQQSSMKEYAYDLAFPTESTQLEVYTKTVKDIIPTILDGYHATIFAYGATGAGKTHTMMGSERDGLHDDEDERDPDVDGIIPHALTDIFTLIEQHRAEEAMLRMTQGSVYEWNVLVSYLEVYNEQIRDLLKPSSKSLSLREDPARGIVHVAGLHHEEAKSVGQVLQLLRRGNRHRRTEPTAANQVSSRSHAVIQVIVKHTTTSMLSEHNPRKSTVEGRLSLIDLAGSERASTTQNRGIRLTEGANINKSLLALANCINSLSTQNRRTRSVSLDVGRLADIPCKTKVQYRDSKLTHLLKNSLEGECRLVMIANVNPSHVCFDESHNTLKYANRAKNIKIRPKMHVVTAEMTYQQRIQKLEKENVHLREVLSNARIELEPDSSKRKGDHLRSDISPNMIKRFKSFPWSNGGAEETQNDQDDAAVLRATIRHLHDEKMKLEQQVVSLRTENEALQGKMSEANKFLNAMARPPAQPSRYSIETPTTQSKPTPGTVIAHSTPSRLNISGPPRRVRVSTSPRTSMIPRASTYKDQENKPLAANRPSSSSLASRAKSTFSFGVKSPNTGVKAHPHGNFAESKSTLRLKSPKPVAAAMTSRMHRRTSCHHPGSIY